MRVEERRDLQAVVAASGAMELLSRAGYIVHGAIYTLIGALASMLALGARGELADPPSAIGRVRHIPGGEVLVSVIAAGLGAYALWRLVQALADPDCQGRSAKGVTVRIGRVVSGLGYAALAFFAGRLATGGVEDGSASTNWVYRLLTEPLGALTGGMVATILFCVATDDARKACTTNFGERFKHKEMGLLLTMFTRCAGSWGFAARAVILVVGGVYLMKAVFNEDPGQARGFEGILASLLSLPGGDWLFGFVALGLGAYGLFMMQAGIFRRHPF